MEARRQNASNASLLSLMINKPNQEDATQEKISKYIDSLTDPYKIVGLSNSGWDVLRAKQKK
jgi:hypothetical protein